jgi:tetraacyldisaccharide 4'-kinase
VNPLLLPLSAAFRFGVAFRHTAYRRGWLKTDRLSRPVVSIGNLTVGGTGKTPLVALVARTLLRCGWKPSILTRGYARRSKAGLIVLAPEPARRADAREVGDEPALLARSLPEVPLIVGADRLRGGRVAEERFQVDAHILDDGFQHLALARALDLVVLDATQALSDRFLLPACRQREPLTALQRAQVVVITRVDSGDSRPLEDTVAKIHPAAQVFRSSTKLSGMVDARSGEAVPDEQIRPEKVTAFCGIGNPRAFFADVRRWGFNLVAEDAFPDHHVYTEQEIHRLVARARKSGAAFLLTTEKDAVKFPTDWRPELPILACVIEAQILAAAEFEKTLLVYLERSKKAD